MSRSLLYSANTAVQNVAVGGNINFGIAIRRFGCNCKISNGNPSVNGIGYYNVTANITATGTAAGTATITLYKDGVAIPGATASFTTADETTYQTTINGVVREKCCCDDVSTITAILSGVPLEVTNASVTVLKE